MFWPILFVVLVLDVWTKYLAHSRLTTLRLPQELLGDLVRLTLVYNPGAAFGLYFGPGSRWILLAISLGALVLLVRMAYQAGESRVKPMALGLIAGGAAGNLINRLWSTAGVVDFIDLGIGTARWPTFNVADMAITSGAVLLVRVLWKEDQHPPLSAHRAGEAART